MVRAVLIDNNPSFLQDLGNIIHSRFPSIEMVNAPNGKVGIEEIESSPPDLCLVHMNLPGEDSFELVRYIKSRHPKVIIGVVSSYDLPEYGEAAYRNGADYFILKNASIEDYYSLFETILPDRGLRTGGAKEGDGASEKALFTRRRSVE